jgi:DDE_Tnp_1-associated
MPAAASVSSRVPEEFALLVSSLATITDSRFARGKVHPLPGVLALVVLGLMADCRSLSAISRYGQIHPEILAPLGLRRSPSVATLHRLLRRVSVGEVRAALAVFSQQLHQRRTAGTGVGAVAVDGKTLRGVWEGGEQLHLLHVFAHASVLALDQVAVASVPGEVPAAQDWLAQVAATFPGITLLTGDALYAEQDLCAAVVAGGRDYLIRLKKTRAPSMPTSKSSSRPNPARPTPCR